MSRIWEIILGLVVAFVIAGVVGGLLAACGESTTTASEGVSSDPVALLRDMFYTPDVKNFHVDGPSSVPPGTYSSVDWPVQAGFTVDYDAPAKDDAGGHKTWFMYLGRKTPDSPWEVISSGTGP